MIQIKIIINLYLSKSRLKSKNILFKINYINKSKIVKNINSININHNFNNMMINHKILTNV